MSRWLKIALSRTVAIRALRMALIVGVLLIAINHWDAILQGEVGAGRGWKMLLTMLVPYCVSTISSVGATLEHEGAAAARRVESA